MGRGSAPYARVTSAARFDAVRCPGQSSDAIANYRSVMISPLRSAATIRPAWRPASVSTAPFWLVRTIPPAPAPRATPAPAAPYTPLTSDGFQMLLTVPTKSVAEAPKVNP